MNIIKIVLMNKNTFSEYFKILFFFPFLLKLVFSISNINEINNINETMIMIILKAYRL